MADTLVRPSEEDLDTLEHVSDLLLGIEEAEARIVRVADRPITFEEFLDLIEDAEWELIDGVMEKKMAAQWDHERLLAWLFGLIGPYVSHKKLGAASQSRTTVRITKYR